MLMLQFGKIPFVFLLPIFVKQQNKPELVTDVKSRFSPHWKAGMCKRLASFSSPLACAVSQPPLPCTLQTVLLNGNSKGVFTSCCYSFIFLVSTCKVGEHFMFPQLPFDLFSVVRSEGSDYFSLPPPTQLQEGGGWVLHSSLSSELLSLFVFIPPLQLHQWHVRVSVARTPHSLRIKSRNVFLFMTSVQWGDSCVPV